MKYFIKTFGCQQNVADSERIASELAGRGMEPAGEISQADHVIINTCMVRRSAEDRVYGLVRNLGEQKRQRGIPQKIIVTGCMVGMAARDKSGKFLTKIRERMPEVDEFLPIEEVGFDHAPLRTDQTHAWVPVSNGCNNFCTFCVVPFTRGREISRPFEEVLAECQHLAEAGYKEITLLGQNVNSYGADLVVGSQNIQVLRDIDAGKYFDNKRELTRPNGEGYRLPSGERVKPVLVKHLGRARIPTLFPCLLEEIVKLDVFEKISFISSNPWDFSEELIDVIAANPAISREIHLPVQAGNNEVLRRMNRWYSREEYLALINQIRQKVPGVTFTTDIIVGFCGETEEQFEDTVNLAQKAGFKKAYISIYSDRPMTAAHKAFQDDVPYQEKKRRWLVLENLINKGFKKKSSPVASQGLPLTNS